jgi:hypothetical protein
MTDSGRSAAKAASGHSPQGLSRDASQAKPSVPNADFQRGVDAARSATFRVLRLLEVSDELFAAVAAATYQVRQRPMPMLGAQPGATDVELEIGGAKNRRALAALRSRKEQSR